MRKVLSTITGNKNKLVLFLVFLSSTGLIFQNCGQLSTNSNENATLPSTNDVSTMDAQSNLRRSSAQAILMKSLPSIKCSKSSYTVGETSSCTITNGDENTICFQDGTVSIEAKKCIDLGWRLDSLKKTLSHSGVIQATMVGNYVLHVQNSQGLASVRLAYEATRDVAGSLNTVTAAGSDNAFTTQRTADFSIDFINPAPMSPGTSFDRLDVSGPISISGNAEITVSVVGIHGYLFEIGTDGINYSPSGAKVVIKNGQKIYLKGRAHPLYRQGHIPVIEVVGPNETKQKNLQIMTTVGCNQEQLILADYEKLAPLQFAGAMRAQCFNDRAITGDTYDATTNLWWPHAGIVARAPASQLLGQFVTNCSEIALNVGSQSEYLAAYQDPYSKVTTRRNPISQCNVSGAITYRCSSSGFWTYESGVCQLR